MSEHLLVGASQLYLMTAAVLAVSGIVFGLLALRESGYRRFMLGLGALPSLSMAAAYVMMGLEVLTVAVTATGRQQSIGRFFAYTIILLTVPYVLKELVGISRRQFAVLSVLLLLMPWSAFVSWITTPPIESLMSLTAFVAYIGSAYLLYVPYSRVAREVGGQRRLLYTKICHLAILSYGGLIITSGLSEQSAGILDFFVGQIIASYADLLFMLSFAGLLYYSKSVFDRRLEEVTRETAETDSTQGQAANTVD